MKGVWVGGTAIIFLLFLGEATFAPPNHFLPFPGFPSKDETWPQEQRILPIEWPQVHGAPWMPVFVGQSPLAPEGFFLFVLGMGEEPEHYQTVSNVVAQFGYGAGRMKARSEAEGYSLESTDVLVDDVRFAVENLYSRFPNLKIHLYAHSVSFGPVEAFLRFYPELALAAVKTVTYTSPVLAPDHFLSSMDIKSLTIRQAHDEIDLTYRIGSIESERIRQKTTTKTVGYVQSHRSLIKLIFSPSSSQTRPNIPTRIVRSENDPNVSADMVDAFVIQLEKLGVDSFVEIYEPSGHDHHMIWPRLKMIAGQPGPQEVLKILPIHGLDFSFTPMTCSKSLDSLPRKASK